MELLGFYDEPYQIQVARPPAPARAREIMRVTPPAPATPEPKSRVATLWETTELDESALEWWKPQVIARRKLGGRRLRTSSTLIALVAVVGISLLAWSALQRPGQRAQESAAAVQGSAAGLAENLAPLSQVAMEIGAPDAPDLAGATAVGLAAESQARALFTEAGELPESGDVMRQAAVNAASAILDASSGLNRLVAYRLTAESVLVAPTLPSDPAASELPEVTAIVADWRAEVTAAVDELPAEVLPENRAGLEGWVAGLEGWQQEYLDAVREGDTGGVTAAEQRLRDDIADLIEGMRQALTDAGAAIAEQVDGAQADLAVLLGG
ncbi:MAG TPA: hypothetical protein VLB85_03995 [Acidimicrobiia bacterium]|nr:hypothetical protein [Acidimicrobiia bacterium]